MPYLEKGDLTPPMRQEIIDTITREDEDIVQRAIAAGISEAKSYLVRFDLPFLFGTDDVEAFDDENLKSKVKDLACWQLIKLSNPNIDMTLFRTSYEDALKWFKEIKTSQLAPDGWKYKPDDADTTFPEGNIVNMISNPKRCHRW